MDLITAFIISAVLFMTAETQLPAVEANTEDNVTHALMTSVNLTDSTAPSALPTVPSSSPEPVLGLLTVIWTKRCEGNVSLILQLPSNSSSLPVCHSQKDNLKKILEKVCRAMKDCQGRPEFHSSPKVAKGFNITEKGSAREVLCETLVVGCRAAEIIPDVRGELKSYKVVTGLLCCVLLILLLIRFTKPTVQALQRRFSDRRQNRWIGPTQSHSVSYHRGKTTVKNSDGDKRLSYPVILHLQQLQLLELLSQLCLQTSSQLQLQSGRHQPDPCSCFQLSDSFPVDQH
ncbi:uncharacterized protein LOC110968699 [Acanthochromis polyacanthus]|uniref:uncharacterized protein LOC110968699 n=1 Tax=Acanthochromis polyacanthus TaxID=80966 RepID=UPI0022347D1E|nr:uncharacterized protein LOC110968699 [Acanthochromis polyacanthus]